MSLSMVRKARSISGNSPIMQLHCIPSVQIRNISNKGFLGLRQEIHPHIHVIIYMVEYKILFMLCLQDAKN